MRQWLLTAVAVVAVLFWVALSVVYARSYLFDDTVSLTNYNVDPPKEGDHGDVDDKYEVESARGRLWLSFSSEDDRNRGHVPLDATGNNFAEPIPPAPHGKRFFHWTSPSSQEFRIERSDSHRGGSFLGIEIGEEYYRGNHGESDVRYVIVPDWALLLPASAIGLMGVRRLTGSKRRRRLRLGLCVSCGYDLRASRERCPECGVAIPVGRNMTKDREAYGRRSKSMA